MQVTGKLAYGKVRHRQETFWEEKEKESLERKIVSFLNTCLEVKKATI
jgi:hypothetical protein